MMKFVWDTLGFFMSMCGASIPGEERVVGGWWGGGSGVCRCSAMVPPRKGRLVDWGGALSQALIDDVSIAHGAEDDLVLRL